MSISNVTFQNSSMVALIETELLEVVIVSCIQLQMSGIMIKDLDLSLRDDDKGLYITQAYNVTILDLSVENISYANIYIQSAYMVTLVNVKVNDNYFSWDPILQIQGIIVLEIGGQFLFRKNERKGVVISAVNNITFKSNSIVEFYDHKIREDLFSVESLTYSNLERGTIIKFETSKLIFENNTSEQGTIMILDEVDIEMTNSEVNFVNNTSYQLDNWNHWSTKPSATMLLKKSTVYLHHSKFNFLNNSASLSGGLTLTGSDIVVRNASLHFEYNTGGDGGAIAFYAKSHITPLVKEESLSCSTGLQDCPLYMVSSTLHFNENRARKRGGGIFIEDADYINSMTRIGYDYFIHNQRKDMLDMRFLTQDNIVLNFSYNTAKLVGNEVYGGWIDLYRANSIYCTWILPQNDQHAVASNPTRICMCESLVPLCNKTQYYTEIFPGQTFAIDAVAVGQRLGVVPSIVHVDFNEEEGSLGEGQDVQNVNNNCKQLKFTVYSAKRFKILNLKVEESGIPHDEFISHYLPLLKPMFQKFAINVILKGCPFGFTFNASNNACVCLESLTVFDGVSCNYDTYKILRTNQIWISTTFEHNDSLHHYGIIAHKHCPYDYCRNDPSSLLFHLEFPDDQCAFNRSGILCGECQPSLSQLFGTSRCKQCSNLIFLALIPVFIIMGIFLVAILMIFNLTVSVGTINGLIFYANVIRASQSIFFPPEFNTSFLNIFIAWLNLDLGIETCFYNGLDAYAKTWLQFLFPLYVWYMVIAITVASHYSTTVSKLTPNNALQVLATLFLLSYTKIIRVVIIVISSTVLVYPDGFRKRVWLYDGNVEFMTGKHVPLFTATLLLLILLSVPYTLSLVSIQWLQKMSHYGPLLWVHRLMPLFDAYTGPYKHKHRYWIGVLLLARVIILTVFTLNQDNNPSVNLLAIAVLAFSLQTYASFVRVYKNWLHNLLEITFLSNLGFLSVACFYQLLNNRSTGLVTTISTSLAFIPSSPWLLSVIAFKK